MTSAMTNSVFGSLGWVVPKKQRALITAYFEAVRKLRQIADDVLTDANTKLQRLTDIRQAFGKGSDADKKNEWAQLGRLFATENLDFSLFDDVLRAVEDDVSHKPIRIWEELLQYCRLYAATQGRFLMTVCGESPTTYLPAEDLSVGLQICDLLSHMVDRVGRKQRGWVPEEMLNEFGVRHTDLGLIRPSESVDNLYAEILSRVTGLLSDAAVLPSLLKRRKLRFKCAVMLSLTNSMLNSWKKAAIGCRQCNVSCWTRTVAVLRGVKLFFMR